MTLLYACQQLTSLELMQQHGCDCTIDSLLAADFDIDDIIDAASDQVAISTGGQVAGRCTQTVRPCADTGCTCGRGADACFCCRMDAIPLKGADPTVTQVKIDGDVIDPSTYGYLNDSGLIRVGTGDRPTSWPGCQHLWRPDTEDGTFSITYTSGILPFVGQMAATELACDFASHALGGESKLPPGTVGAVMDGVSVTLDPDTLNAFPWMIRLLSSYPGSVRPVVWSPEVDGGWQLHSIS